MPEAADLARRYYELLNARDLDRCVELLHPEFELRQPSLPDGGVYVGADGLRRWLSHIDDAWSEARWEPQDYTEAGNSVVVTVRFVARGTHTGIEQAAQRFQVIRVRDGRIAFATGYPRLEQALEAATAS